MEGGRGAEDVMVIDLHAFLGISVGYCRCFSDADIVVADAA